MAPLDARFQTAPDPEYLRYSKPIQQPAVPQSGAILAKGLGEAAADTIGGISKTVGAYVTEKTHEQLGEAAEQEESRINPLWETATKNPSNLMAQLAQQQSLGTLSSDVDLPVEIKTGIKQVGSLDERFKNGKISATDYKSDKARILKDLNSTYPMFRSNISAGIQLATGEGSADAMIASKIQDINRVVAQLRQTSSKADAALNQSLKYIPDQQRADLLHRRYDLPENDPNHLSDTQALWHAGKYEHLNVQQEQDQRALAIEGEKRKLYKDDFDQAVTKTIASNTEKFMHGFAVSQGMDSMDDLVNKLRSSNLNDESKLKLMTDFQSNLDGFKAGLRRDAAEYMKMPGADYNVVNKQIKAATEFFDDQLNRARNTGDPLNPIYASKNYADAFQRDMHYMLTQQPEARKRMVAKAIDDLNPDYAGKINQDIMANEKDFTANNKGLYDHMVRSVLGVPPGDTNNNPPNIKSYLDLNLPPKSKLDIVGFVNKMTDRSTDVESAYRIGKAFFRSENQGMVGKWALDDYNEQTKKTTVGRINVFKILGDAGVADKVLEVAKKGHPDLFTDYTNFMQDTFKREVFPDLLDSVKTLSVGADWRLGYNADTAQFDLKPKAGSAAEDRMIRHAMGGSNPVDRQLESIKNKLNYVFGSMVNVAKISGYKDPNAYILSLITQERPDAFTKEVPGFPGEVNAAIKNQALAREFEKQKKEELQKKGEEMSK